MIGRSPLRRFVTVVRDFGFVVAMRVAYSSLRGRLYPSLALQAAPLYDAPHREVSILLSTAEHGDATMNAVVEILAGRGRSDWEVCIGERAPVAPEMARALARFRGTQPWIRIVTTDRTVDDAVAARWTVEQATGQFVALVAPGYTPESDAIGRLLARLHDVPGIDAAVLCGTENGSGGSLSRVPLADCRLVLQRKAGYLAALPRRWSLSLLALVQDLELAGVPIAYIAARKRGAPD